MAVVKNLMVRCGADFSALTKATNQAKSSINSMSRSTQKATNSIRRSAGSMQSSIATAGKSASSAFSGLGKAIKAAGIAVAVQQIVAGLSGLTKEAVSVDAQVSNLSRTMGNSQAAFMSWAKNSAAAFGISESAAVRYGNAYSNLISGFISDTSISTAYTKQLIETSAVIASRTGRTVEDVSERIRSGLLGNTEAIEDLGINVNVALLETTDAFNRLARGRSWQQLTFQEQQQVRLFAILEQSAEKFGDELSGGGSSALLSFNAQLENLKLNLGRAFAPILETVIPALTSFIAKLSEGIAKVTAFFAALRGIDGTDNGVDQIADSADKAASELNDTTEAVKETKNATTGIDELNILSTDTATAEAAGGASTGAGSSEMSILPEVVDESDAITGTLDKLLKYVQGFGRKINKALSPSFDAWGTAFASLQGPATSAFQTITSSTAGLWNETLLPFGEYLTFEFVPGIANSFSENIAPIFAEVMPVAISEFAKDWEWACGEVDRITNDILYPAFEFIQGAADDIFSGIKTAWDEHGAGFLEGCIRFRESLREIWDTVYTNVIKPVIDRIGGTISWLWDQHLKPLWDKLTDFFGSVTESILALWNNVLAPVVDFVVKVVGPLVSHVVGSIGDVVGTVIGVIADVIGGILESLSGLLDFLTGVFTGNWEKAWGGIQKFFKGIWDGIWGIVKGIVNLIIDGLNTLWGAVYSVASGIVNGIGGIAEVIGDLFGQDWGFSMPAEPPLIPKLAAGGLAYGPTLAMIGEGQYKEAVLPLNSTVYSELAQGINSFSDKESISILRSLDGRLLRLLEWAERFDHNFRFVVDDRELAQAVTTGNKKLGYPVRG